MLGGGGGAPCTARYKLSQSEHVEGPYTVRAGGTTARADVGDIYDAFQCIMVNAPLEQNDRRD